MSKQFYTWFTCCLFAILTALPLSVKADEFTLNANATDGTGYLPVYGLYVDTDGTHGQTLILASDLSELGVGATINALTYYLKSPAAAAWNAQISVKLAETTETSLASAFVDMSSAREVYNGSSLVATGSTMVVTFTTPYSYQGGNLVIDFEVISSGTYKSATFYAVNAAGMGRYAYDSYGSMVESANAYQPKITFDYESAATGSCARPGNITLGDVTTHTAAFSWTASEDRETSWILLVKEGNNVLVDNETVSTPSYTVTGLSSSSVHTLSVEVIHACEDDSTSRATTLKFATLCEAIADLPWTEDFESMDKGSTTSEAPLCWSLLNANDGAYPYIFVNNSSSYVHGGTQSLYFQSSDSRAGYAILPSFADSALVDAEIIFYYKHENATSSGIPAVGYITNIADASTFVAIQELERYTSWTKAQVELGTIPSGARLAIRYAKQSSNYYMGIDDIEVRKLPNCRPPRRLWIDTITTNSAKLAWHPTAASGNYQVKVKNGEAVLADSRVDGDTTFVISGLEHSSMYRNLAVDIFSICSASDSSEVFSTTVSFNTACQTMEFTKDSLILGFNDYDSGELLADLPCWDTIRGAGVTADWKISTTAYNNTAKSAYITSRGAGKYAVLISPAIEISAGYELQAYAKESSHYDTDSLIFYVNDAPVLEGATRIGDMKALSTSWQQFRQELGRSGELYILIQAYGTGTIYVDELLLKPAPVCPLTTGLVRDSLSYDYVRFSWQAAEGQNAWKVNISDTRGEIAVYDEVVNDPFYEIDYLEPLTTDTVTVKVIGMCEAGNSEEVLEETFIFTTLASCPIPDSLSVSDITGNSAKIAWKIGISDNYNVRYRLPAPDATLLSQDFEDGMAGWNITGNSSSAISTSANYTGSKGFSFHYDYSNQYLISPELSGIDADGALEFYYKNSSTSYVETFKVGFSSTTTSAFTYGEEISASDSEWHKYTGTVPAGTKYICIQLTSYDKYYLYIDDIKVIGSAGNAGEWATVENIAQKSAQLSGLAPETDYEAQVQAVCASESSEWSQSIKFRTLAACVVPSDLAAKLTLGNGTIATLNWTAPVATTAWLVQYSRNANFSDSIQVAVSDTATLDLTGLTAEATYYARVKTVCSEEAQSAWSEAISFKPTNSYSLTINEGTTTNEYVPIYGYYCDLGNKSQFIIPAATLSSIQWGSITQLTFYASTQSVDWSGAQFEVYMSEVETTTLSAMYDWSTLDKVMNSAEITLSGGKMVVTLDAPYQYSDGNLLIGIQQSVNGDDQRAYWYGVTATGASIGGSNGSPAQRDFLPMMTVDFVPGVAPACAKPARFDVDSLDAHSISLSWAPGEGAAWRLEYKKAAVEAWTVLPQTLTDTLYVLAGLDAATEYDIRIATMCAPADDPEALSAYVKVSATTECTYVSAVNENFESVEAGELPICWNAITETNTYGTYPIVLNDESIAHSGSNELYFASVSGTTAADQYVALPQIEDVASKRINFYARMENATWEAVAMSVGVMTDPEVDSTFVAVANYTLTSAEYAQYIVPFNSYAGNGQYIAIKMAAAATADNYAVLIVDDVVVEEIPNCANPLNLNATLTYGNGSIATLSWQPGESETAWEVEYSTDSQFTNALSVNVNDTAVAALAELTAEATYYARVRAICGVNNVSPWSDVITFVPTNAIATTVNNGSTTNDYVPVYGYWTDHNSRSQFIIPADSLTAIQWGTIKKLIFHASTASASWGAAQFEVYMAEAASKSISELADWSTLTKVMNAASLSISGNQMVVELSEPYYYDGGNLLIGINQTVAGSYSSCNWLGVYASGASVGGYDASISQRNFLPKMTIEYLQGEAPSCLKPTGLAIAGLTATGATLSWDNTENGAWQYAVALASAEVPAEFIDVTDTFAVVSELNEMTDYIFYLRSNCGAEDGISEVISIAFHTLQLPVAVGTGFSDDFENGNNWLFVNGAKHGWVIGEAAHNGVGTHAMYVSTDNGVTNDYYVSATNIVYAKKLLTFSEGSYEFNYDWRAYGESSVDFLRVALVADSVELTAGTIPTGLTSSALPTGWIALDGGSKLNLQSTWQHYTSAEIAIAAGTYNVVFAWKNDYSAGTNPSAAVDNFEISKILCAKPTALAATEVSSSKATISWSSAEDGAWQIALDTLSGFNPDSVPAYIAADTNLYHLVELAAGKSYYAYVRMNCGENGFSSWSSKLSFSTPAGNLAPTGLAVDASSLTDQAATVIWKGIATNDKHESFELYCSKLAALPETLNADSLITAIADTMYSFSGLETEATYYVWVRDNCGSDGMSAWTAAVSFTTLNSCPVPANLSVANITAHTADIAWEIGNNESYNVRYRKSAGIDADLSEEFGTAKPTDWSMYTGLYNEAAGTATLTEATYGWSFGTGSNGVFDNHARVNIYDNYQRWLATPAITVNNAVLEFDLALTAYSGALAAPATTGTDDKFIVLVSEDNKASWQVLRKWDNAGSQYVYNNIPNTADGEHVSISLNAYNGKSIIIAFYGESTVSNADNNLHIDNVVVGSVIAEEEWAIANGTAAKQLQLTGLDPETTYEAQVQGICGTDATEWSEEIIRFKTIEACFAPSAPAVSEITAHGATLSWHSDADAWQICLNGDEDNLIAANDTLFVLTGLPADSAYTVKVRTNCGSEGFSKWSNSVSFTTLVACAVPTHVVANDVRAHSAEISWSSDATAWQICLDGNEDNLIDVTDTVYVVTGLAADTAHTVKVRANCGDEGFSKWSSVVRFTTLVACPAPQGLRAELTPGDGSVARLVWETADANAWVVEYSLNADMSDSISVEVDDATLSLTGLTADTTYYARVKADCGDEDGVSLWSSVISFVPTDRYEMIINDGTVTNSYIPLYMLYLDEANNQSQFIVPAETLVAIAGDTITSLTFYANNTKDLGDATFEVYMAEVDSTTLADTTAWSDLNLVMAEANLTLANNQMVVELSAPYGYLGGNLMIGFKQIAKNTAYYTGVSWYGVEAEGASYSIYGNSKSKGQRNFLPKMKINFIPVEKETAVEEILNGAGSDGKAVKFIRDNRVYILRDGVVYDILGAVVR